MRFRDAEIARGIYMVSQNIMLKICEYNARRPTARHGKYICDTSAGTCIAVYASYRKGERPQVAEFPDRGAAIRWLQGKRTFDLFGNKIDGRDVRE